MARKIRDLGVVFAGIAIALTMVDTFLSAPVMADPDCVQGCQESGNGACTGEATERCDQCAIPPVTCSGLAGKTSYSGTAAHGSTTGANEITFQSIDCIFKRNCGVTGVDTGSCVLFLGQGNCQSAGSSGCTLCGLGDQFVLSTYQDCRIVNNPDPCAGG